MDATSTTELSLNQAPSPQKFFVAFEYFDAYFKFRQTRDGQFSYDIWAAEMGYGTRTYYRLICQGKRSASPRFLSIFIRLNGLNSDQGEYLRLIVLYHKAKTVTEKKIFLDRIYETKQADTENIDVKHYAHFLSHRQLPILKLMLAFSDVRTTCEMLARNLGSAKSTVFKNLLVLEKMGLVNRQLSESNADVFWVTKSKDFNLPGQSGDAALALFHVDSMAEAQEALNSKKVFKRFRSIYFSMAENQFSEFTAETEKFLKLMQNKFGSSTLRDQYIFKLNLNGYPVTEKCLGSEET